jgi:hypothetical protein
VLRVAKIDLEHHILTLWTTTKLPLNVVTLRITSALPKELIEKTLDKMTVEGALEMNTDDAGNLSWSVLGTPRSTTGPESIAQYQMLDRVRGEVALEHKRSSSSALAVGGERKSILASTALSFFFGGFGLLYAAPLPVAVGTIAVQVILASLLPHSLFAWLCGIALPLSGIAGGAYAWTHNKNGKRTGIRELLGPSTKKALPPRR